MLPAARARPERLKSMADIRRDVPDPRLAGLDGEPVVTTLRELDAGVRRPGSIP